MTVPLHATASKAMMDAMGTYTITESNFERVVGLITRDVMKAIEPEVEKRVRLMYAGVFAGVTSGN